MFAQLRKFVLISVFALLVVAGINFVWWANYDKTEQLLESQLARRLSTVVSHSGANLKIEWLYGVIEGDFDAFIELSEYLENSRRADSLAEMFILDQNYHYIASTLIEPEEEYFHTNLHGQMIDSLFYSPERQTLITPTYQSGSIYLKSAFSSVHDANGNVIALLGAEASVDYFESMAALRENLYFSTILSLAGGLIAGAIMICLQLRINRVESAAFLNQTELFLGRMVAVVAHEIRNPLAIIRGSGERLLFKTDSEEARFIVEEIDRLSKVLTDYLEFARGGKSLLATEQREQIDITQFFSKIKSRFETEFETVTVEWTEFEIEQSLKFRGFSHALHQVIYNLLLNGAQSCLSSGDKVSLGLKARKVRDRIEISLSDQGSGLSRRQLKNVFTPFYTTKVKGSGLGLYLSRKIVREMGGELTLKNAPSAGLEAQLSLPMSSDSAKSESEKYG